MNFVVESERDLIEKVWGSLKKKARAGVRIGLSGDLGAGKTTFISGIAKILGVKELVTSPTFAISKIYKTDSKNLPILQHIDLYRLGDVSRANIDEIIDMVDSGEALTFVEWPEKVEGIMQKMDIVVRISPAGEHSRKVEIRDN